MHAVVIQPGARHGYALPRFLQNAGALQRLYTDFAIAAGSIEHAMLRSIGSTKVGQKLSRRVVTGIPAASICRFPLSALGSHNAQLAGENPWNFRADDLREAGVNFTDGESGIMVPPTDVEALVEAILSVIGNRPLRAAMAASARAEFMAYDDDAWAASFIGGLHDVLRNG